MSVIRPARVRAGREPRATSNAVAMLAEHADAHALDLAAYHDACRQVRAILGTKFVEYSFAHDVLVRLKLDGNDVAAAVRGAQDAAFDLF
jgi:hypothetical protein